MRQTAWSRARFEVARDRLTLVTSLRWTHRSPLHEGTLQLARRYGRMLRYLRGRIERAKEENRSRAA